MNITYEAEAARQSYTFGMAGDACAVMESVKSHDGRPGYFTEGNIRQAVIGALNEVSNALVCSSAYSKDAMAIWCGSVCDSLESPNPEEQGIQSGEDLIRMLKKDGALTGAAVFCKDNGVWPYFLTLIIACAFTSEHGSDKRAAIVKEYADYYGIKPAVRKYCELENEPELLQMINRHYDNVLAGVREEPLKVDLMKKAYRAGFMSEKTYRGCAQCTLKALFDLSGRDNETLFKCASAFSGGMALSGDGVCGGYSGGLMFMSNIVGRRLKEMLIDGDKPAQYESYDMSQKLREQFLQTYGSVVCSDVHEGIFGRAFCLSTSAVREEFEDAGAHTNKCTNVIGTACTFVAEILYDSGYSESIAGIGEDE